MISRQGIETKILNSVHAAKIFAKMWRYLQIAKKSPTLHHKLKRRFGKEFVHHFKIQTRLTGDFSFHAGPRIFVSNHISYVDIPVLLGLLPQASFVAKAEVGTWPIIGPAAKVVDTILVKRDSKKSREATRIAIANALTQENKQVILFPSGTTKIKPMQQWKKGAFEIAAQLGVPIQPIRIVYKPLRPLAYIDDDSLVTHLIDLPLLENIEVHVEIGPPQMVKCPQEDCDRVRRWCEEILPV